MTLNDPAIQSPTFIYGTAWKKDATAELVQTALDAGFRAIDTANQARHYNEPAVGEALAQSGVAREDLFLQTKFTPVNGQDHRLPYDPDASLTTQVEQSFASSLEHLNTDYVDSYLLHGPYSFPGLSDSDWEVWAAISKIHESGTARAIGISNVNAGQLAALIERADTPPAFVQNRCFANQGWDRDVRDLCRRHGIAYQGFSLLTANVPVLRHPGLVDIARRLDVGILQVVFRFAIDVGMVPLTGTSDADHMRQDLEILDSDRMRLTPEEIALIESAGI